MYIYTDSVKLKQIVTEKAFAVDRSQIIIFEQSDFRL